MEGIRRTPDGFVSATVAAGVLGVNRRLLLALAERGIGGAYPITVARRTRWVFRLPELGIAIDHRHPRPFPDDLTLARKARV